MSTPAKILTNAVLEAVSRQLGGVLAQRFVGQAVPWQTVARAIGLITEGRSQEGVNALRGGRLVIGIVGEPDLSGWITINGRAIYTGIEVKAGADRLRPEQSLYGKALLEAGGIWIEGRSVEQVITDMRRITI